MFSTIPENILLDPIVILELLTLLGTVCYIAKVVLSDHCTASGSDSSFFNGSASYGRSLRPLAFHQRGIEQKLLSLFGVGCLISQPKSALKQQRTLRRAYSYRF